MTKITDQEGAGNAREVSIMDGDLEKRKIRGERIHRLRIKKGSTQIELGLYLGLASPSATISLIERGLQGMSLEQVEKIAQFFGVHPLVIATGNDYNDEQLDFLNHCFLAVGDPDPSTRNVVHSIFEARQKQS